MQIKVLGQFYQGQVFKNSEKFWTGQKINLKVFQTDRPHTKNPIFFQIFFLISSESFLLKET